MKMVVAGLPETLTEDQQQELGRNFLILIHPYYPVDGIRVEFESEA